MALVLLLIALALSGCGRDATTSPVALVPSDLSGASFHVLAKDKGESTILLGDLSFDTVAGDQVSGTFNVRAWSGTGVPGLPAHGTFTGTFFGGSAILSLPLAQGALGVVLSERKTDRIAGTVAFLPSRSFEGGIEAISASGAGAAGTRSVR